MNHSTREKILEAARVRAAERFNRRDWESAERDYDLLVRIGGESADDLARLGVAKIERGAVAHGAACLSRALEKAPDHGPARVHFAEALIRLGSVGAGVAQLKALWDARKSDDPDLQAPHVQRAAAVLAIARYAAENSTTSEVLQKS